MDVDNIPNMTASSTVLAARYVELGCGDDETDVGREPVRCLSRQYMDSVFDVSLCSKTVDGANTM